MNKLDELWNELLEQKPTNYDLRYIIDYVEPLREKAKKMIKRPKEEVVRDIINFK